MSKNNPQVEAEDQLIQGAEEGLSDFNKKMIALDKHKANSAVKIERNQYKKRWGIGRVSRSLESNNKESIEEKLMKDAIKLKQLEEEEAQTKELIEFGKKERGSNKNTIANNEKELGLYGRFLTAIGLCSDDQKELAKENKKLRKVNAQIRSSMGKYDNTENNRTQQTLNSGNVVLKSMTLFFPPFSIISFVYTLGSTVFGNGKLSDFSPLKDFREALHKSEPESELFNAKYAAKSQFERTKKEAEELKAKLTPEGTSAEMRDQLKRFQIERFAEKLAPLQKAAKEASEEYFLAREVQKEAMKKYRANRTPENYEARKNANAKVQVARTAKHKANKALKKYEAEIRERGGDTTLQAVQKINEPQQGNDPHGAVAQAEVGKQHKEKQEKEQQQQQQKQQVELTEAGKRSAEANKALNKNAEQKANTEKRFKEAEEANEKAQAEFLSAQHAAEADLKDTPSEEQKNKKAALQLDSNQKKEAADRAAEESASLKLALDLASKDYNLANQTAHKAYVEHLGSWIENLDKPWLKDSESAKLWVKDRGDADKAKVGEANKKMQDAAQANLDKANAAVANDKAKEPEVAAAQTPAPASQPQPPAPAAALDQAPASQPQPPAPAAVLAPASQPQPPAPAAQAAVLTPAPAPAQPPANDRLASNAVTAQLAVRAFEEVGQSREILEILQAELEQCNVQKAAEVAAEKAKATAAEAETDQVRAELTIAQRVIAEYKEREEKTHVSQAAAQKAGQGKGQAQGQ